MRAGDARLDGPRFGDGEDRLVLDGLGLDPERGETVEKFLGGGHGGNGLDSGLAVQEPRAVEALPGRTVR